MSKALNTNLLLFRSELIELLTNDDFDNNNIANYFNDVGFVTLEGGKSFFNYFYFVNYYLANSKRYDINMFEKALNTYKEFFELNQDEENFIRVSFHISYMLSTYWEHTTKSIINKTNEALELAEQIGITEPNTLLVIYRLQLRALIDSMANPTEDKREKMIAAKNKLAQLIKEVENVIPNEMANTYFFS